jgi:hypothetical protein
MRVQIWTCKTGLWVCATLLLALSVSSEAAATAKHMEPVDYVSPNIGGIGQLLTATVPYVQMPHGMARLADRIERGFVLRRVIVSDLLERTSWLEVV